MAFRGDSYGPILHLSAHLMAITQKEKEHEEFMRRPLPPKNDKNPLQMTYKEWCNEFSRLHGRWCRPRAPDYIYIALATHVRDSLESKDEDGALEKEATRLFKAYHIFEPPLSREILSLPKRLTDEEAEQIEREDQQRRQQLFQSDPERAKMFNEIVIRTDDMTDELYEEKCVLARESRAMNRWFRAMKQYTITHKAQEASWAELRALTPEQPLELLVIAIEKLSRDQHASSDADSEFDRAQKGMEQAKLESKLFYAAKRGEATVEPRMGEEDGDEYADDGDYDDDEYDDDE